MSDGLSLRTICKRKDMPSTVAVFKWLKIYPEFKTIYDIAKEERARAFVEDIIDLTDQEPPSFIDEKGTKKFDSAGVNWHKMRCDNRKWLASKILPKEYGERLQHANDPDNPMPTMTIYCPQEEEK